MTSPIAPSLPGSDTQMVVERADMSALLQVLKARGYDVIGPTVRDGSVVYDHLESVEDLPVGWTDEQDAGAYHLKRRGDQALFGFTIGPQAWKRYLYPPKAQ